ncbi:MAG: hypothetical protein PHP03_00420 [Candidatus Pacebacteria bacterium]|nr:hypothetical protein [Candidatus Paceibacterota bacterium]
MRLSKYIIILIVGVLLAAGLAVYYFGVYKKTNNSISTPINSNENAPSLSGQTPKQNDGNDLTTWKTYKDDETGINFKYPESYIGDKIEIRKEKRQISFEGKSGYQIVYTIFKGSVSDNIRGIDIYYDVEFTYFDLKPSMLNIRFTPDNDASVLFYNTDAKQWILTTTLPSGYTKDTKISWNDMLDLLEKKKLNDTHFPKEFTRDGFVAFPFFHQSGGQEISRQYYYYVFNKNRPCLLKLAYTEDLNSMDSGELADIKDLLKYIIGSVSFN